MTGLPRRTNATCCWTYSISERVMFDGVALKSSPGNHGSSGWWRDRSLLDRMIDLDRFSALLADKSIDHVKTRKREEGTAVRTLCAGNAIRVRLAILVRFVRHQRRECFRWVGGIVCFLSGSWDSRLTTLMGTTLGCLNMPDPRLMWGAEVQSRSGRKVTQTTTCRRAVGAHNDPLSSEHYGL
jgi:hypothetical protein